MSIWIAQHTETGSVYIAATEIECKAFLIWDADVDDNLSDWTIRKEEFFVGKVT